MRRQCCSFNAAVFALVLTRAFFVMSTESSPCNIDRRNNLTVKEFVAHYRDRKPVIVRGVTDNSRTRSLTEKNILLKRLGSSVLRLSTANSYTGRNFRNITFSDYLATVLRKEIRGADTLYFFGPLNTIAASRQEDWATLLDDYKTPPWPTHVPQCSKFDGMCLSESDSVADQHVTLSFGIGGSQSGVPFHTHGPGFSEMLHGRKRWLLYPPSLEPPGWDPDASMSSWIEDVYPGLSPHRAVQSTEHDTYKGRQVLSIKPLECIIGPSEVLYFPAEWYHATLNIDSYTCFVSSFT